MNQEKSRPNKEQKEIDKRIDMAVKHIHKEYGHIMKRLSKE